MLCIFNLLYFLTYFKNYLLIVVFVTVKRSVLYMALRILRNSFRETAQAQARFIAFTFLSCVISSPGFWTVFYLSLFQRAVGVLRMASCYGQSGIVSRHRHHVPWMMPTYLPAFIFFYLMSNHLNYWYLHIFINTNQI